MQRREFLAVGGSVAALALGGCQPKGPATTTDAPVDESKLRELKVFLVDDAPFAEALTRDWKSTSQRPISIQSVSAGELLAMSEIAADVVIYPPRLLGELAESGRIMGLDERTLAKPELARDELIDLARVKLGNWGDRPLGIPLSAPSLLVVYRADAVASGEIPATWREFDEFCKTLPAERPAALDPLAKESRCLVFLARAASRARGVNQHSTLFDVSTMKALIGGPPFVRALEEIAARAQGQADAALAKTPHDVWNELVSGKAAVGLTWPFAGEAGQGNEQANLQFSILPGGREYYSLGEKAWLEEDQVRRFPVIGGAGRLVSVVRGKSGFRDGANLLVLLAGKSRADALAHLTKDAFPCRQSQLSQVGKWLGGVKSAEMETRFAKAVVDSLTASDFLSALNLPGEAEYSAALGQAIEQAVRGEKNAAASLGAAAESWDAITEKLGSEKQRLAYSRSLGLEKFG